MQPGDIRYLQASYKEGVEGFGVGDVTIPDVELSKTIQNWMSSR